MNTIKKVFPILVLSALVLGACSSVVPAASSDSVQDKRTVSVNGQGTVTLTPDMATISVGVQTQGAEAEEAVAENNAKAEAITAALKEFGIEDKDIKTTNFSVYPRQRYNDDGEIVDVTYIVQNTVMVTVRDLEILGEVLDASVAAGANNIYGVSFDIADRESAYAQAIEAAVANARTRADALAAAADAKLGEALKIDTFIGGGGVFVEMETRGLDMAMAEESAVPVSPGEMEIHVDVTVIYELK